MWAATTSKTNIPWLPRWDQLPNGGQVHVTQCCGHLSPDGSKESISSHCPAWLRTAVRMYSAPWSMTILVQNEGKVQKRTLEEVQHHASWHGALWHLLVCSKLVAW